MIMTFSLQRLKTKLKTKLKFAAHRSSKHCTRHLQPQLPVQHAQAPAQAETQTRAQAQPEEAAPLIELFKRLNELISESEKRRLHHFWLLEAKFQRKLPGGASEKFAHIHKRFLSAPADCEAGEESTTTLAQLTRGLKALGCHLSDSQVAELFELCGGCSLRSWVSFCTNGSTHCNNYQAAARLRQSLLIDLSRLNLYALEVSRLFPRNQALRNVLFAHAFTHRLLQLPGRKDYEREWEKDAPAAGEEEGTLEESLPFVNFIRDHHLHAPPQQARRHQSQIAGLAKFCHCEDAKAVWRHLHTYLMLRNRKLSALEAFGERTAGTRELFCYDGFYCELLPRTGLLRCILVTTTMGGCYIQLPLQQQAAAANRNSNQHKKNKCTCVGCRTRRGLARLKRPHHAQHPPPNTAH